MRTTFLSIIALLFTVPAQAHKIIQIGDSQSHGIFGEYLHEKIRTRTTSDFTLYSRGGSTVDSWLDYQKLKGRFRIIQPNGNQFLLERDHMTSLKKILSRRPDTVIIQLGGNMVRQSDEHIQEQVEKITSFVKHYGANCIWIGPPNGWKRPQQCFSEFYPVLKQAAEAGGCTFVDSRKYTYYPKGRGDGIHYDKIYFGGDLLVSNWVNHVFRKIKNLL